MTAAVIMQLAQESKLGLNDPVSKYVPGVPNGDNITVAQLPLVRMARSICLRTSTPSSS